MSQTKSSTKKKQSRSKSAKVTITAALTALVGALIVIGQGSGSVTITELDDMRSAIVCEVPPEGMDSSYYEVIYQESNLGKSAVGDPNGIVTLTSLISNKSDFTLKFYLDDKLVGESTLDKFKVNQSNTAKATMMDKGNLDVHLSMSTRHKFRFYSTTKSTESELPLTLLMLDTVSNIDEVMSDSELFDQHVLYLNQYLPFAGQLLDVNFSINKTKHPDGISELWINSDYWNYPKVAKVPEVVELESGDLATLLDYVPDNSIKINNDVYTLDSTNYTRDNILDSRKRGGGQVVIQYKLNGSWYDLTDPNYKSYKYFIDDNAISDQVIETEWVPNLDRYYQGMFDYIKFTDQIDIPLTSVNKTK